MEDVARKMGFKQTWRIRERTDLLRLHPKFQDMVHRKYLTPSQGFEMSRLPHDKQFVIFGAVTAGRADTYNKLRAMVNALLVPPPKQETFGEELDEKEAAVGKKYDRLIENLARFINGSFSDKDLKILSKVLASSAAVNIQKINLIINDLNKIKKALTLAESKQEVFNYNRL